ncbi:MAG: cobalt-precorrin 5A hydrolase [Methanoregula sp.]|uniref:cobalt-precorrin 5A hydrolase n=1 Tax=Methanoregula sp. TaxID=2052170 RepID=UPI0025D67B87|nr:cobalt-precorrin 5A hydrolase [Methanoregula sp.]MCK9630957.1 cobalt-precorrin 5A hydrolase [Methanoregula sp.]
MNDTVVITFPYSRTDAERIAAFLNADIVEYSSDIFSTVFAGRKRIVALMSMGIVVRKIASLLDDKWTDPAVVVVSPDLRFAVPVLGGHHGANSLAKELAGLGLVPVITTATESRGRDSVETIAERTGTEVLNRDSTRQVNAALLENDIPVHAVHGPAIVLAGPGVSLLVRKGVYSVGIGCRKGIRPEEVSDAVRTALAENGIAPEDVLIYATTQKKFNETGLVEAVASLSGNLIFLDDDTINAQAGTGPSRATRLGLLGVAEPCALAVSGSRTLVMGKKVFGRVTVAIAR